MRVIHAWVDNDKSKQAMANHYTALTREELDARSSTQAKACPFKEIKIAYEDKNFNPTSTLYPELHPGFENEVDISYDAVKKFGPITSEKVKELLTKMRCTLNIIIAKWERSGNGDGSRGDDDNDEFTQDDIENDVLPCIGGADDRANFLKGECISHLYLWQKSKEHEVFHTVMQRICNDANMTGEGGVGSARSRGPNKRKHDEVDEELAKQIRKTSEALENYNIEMMTSKLRDLENILLDEEDKEDLLLATRGTTDRQKSRQRMRVVNGQKAIKEQEARLTKYLKQTSC